MPYAEFLPDQRAAHSFVGSLPELRDLHAGPNVYHRGLIGYQDASSFVPPPPDPQGAQRSGPIRLKGEVLGRDALLLLRPAWQHLSERSAEDNVYYSPRYAEALLGSIEKNIKLNVAVVWSGAQLVAMLPFTVQDLRVPLLQPIGQAWCTKYTFSCTPLLDRSHTTEAAEGLVDVLSTIRAGQWLLPTLNAQGEACRAIIAALQRRRVPWLLLNRFQRATLEANGTCGKDWENQLSSKRRRDLARNRRRLKTLGKVKHEVHCSGEALDVAVKAFLKIEAGGWKGKRGTALACDPDTRRFAIAAFTGDKKHSICRADVLTLDGQPIAVSLMTFANGTGFTVKSSYDEAFRSYGAGLLLEVEVIRSFLSGRWAHRLDAATAGTHVIDDLWPGRIEVADLVFSLAPRGAEARLLVLRRAMRMRQQIKTGLLSCLSALRPFWRRYDLS